ncbi:unnamed protein product [Didymodactylos carnosus]|uniref:Uncharacterized protein n=1 Tax=Didymodactylos carnosus TaxID=1234261 RepID=A0A813SV65_9BILA|nr:unnamed protein product [Didymodactylos carnosus]CAF3584595.1 unnamed protein product [Didymodactylos carnosus]
MSSVGVVEDGKRFCLNHFNEHFQQLLSQVHPCEDDLNELYGKLTKITAAGIKGNLIKLIDLWCNSEKLKIDKVATNVKKLVCSIDLEPRLESNKQSLSKQIAKTNEDIEKYLESQQISEKQLQGLQRKIMHLQTVVEKLKESIELSTTSINYSDMIRIKSSPGIFIPSLGQPVRIIHTLNEHHTLASSDSTILLYDYDLVSNNKYLVLCNHLDASLTKIPWISEHVQDICWSESARIYILMTQKSVCTLDLNSVGTFQDIDNVVDNDQDYIACTCNRNNFYITTKSKIDYYTIEDSVREPSLQNSQCYFAFAGSKTMRDAKIKAIHYNNDQKLLGVLCYDELSNHSHLKLYDEEIQYLINTIVCFQFDTPYLTTLCDSNHLIIWLIGDSDPLDTQNCSITQYSDIERKHCSTNPPPKPNICSERIYSLVQISTTKIVIRQRNVVIIYDTNSHCVKP